MFVFTSQWVLQGKAMMRQGENKPVLENWVPDGMYRRYIAVRCLACKQQHKNKVKTQIRFGQNDFTLMVIKTRNDFWQPVPMSDLPDFQPYKRLGRKTKQVRSPTRALGRPKYGGTVGRIDKRALSMSPGYSPESKQSKPNPENSSSDSGTTTTPPGRGGR